MSKKQNLNIGSDSFQNEQLKIGKDSGDNSTSIDSGIYSDQLYHHSSDFGSSKYDDSNLDPFYIQNKEYLNTRAVRQDNWDKAGNGITRAAAKIVPRAIEGIVNPFYGTVAALAHTDEEGNWDPSFNSFYDNSLTNGVQAASEFLDKELPLYATREAQNAKGLEKLLYANTLWGDVLDGMSYSAAAMVSGGAWSKAINLLGKSAAVGKAGEFLSGWSKIDNAADANKYVTQFENTLFNIKDGAKKGMTAFVGATTEASDNALSDSKEWYKDMEYKLTHDLSGNKVRNLTDGEKDWLEQNRKDLGNASFAMNLPVIMADNWITFGRSMFSKKSAEKALLSDVANKSIRDEATDSYKMAAKSAVDKFLSKTYGARQFVTPMVSEGLQEVEQLGVSKGTQDYYTKKYYNPEAADFLDSFGVGFSQAMSKEGLEAFMIGAISSGIFGNATKLATEGTAGYTDQTDDVTKQAINYLNANKSKPAFKAMVEAFNRHSNLAVEYDQAVKANDDFEAVNKAQDMMINHITSKIKTGKLDDFKKDLASFEKLSPEEFEGSYGIKLSNDQVTGLKQSMSSFIKPKLDAANKVEKLHNALENMFPNAPQSIKDRLLYASYSLENSADRANELSTKVQKTLQENQSRYGTNVLINNAFVPTNYFKLDVAARKEFVRNITESQEISPIDKEQILKDVADIDKLDQRRLSFIEDYKSLSNAKVQNDLITKDTAVEEELPATVEGAEKEAKDTEEAEQLAEEGQSIDPFADAILNEDINKFAERIKSGEKLTSPEDLEFYQNNKEKVEARLKELGNQLNSKDDTKLESSYPENEEEIYPRVYESNAAVNPLRTGALKDIVLQPKEVSELIEKLRSKGKDINDTIKLRAVDFNGKKSIQILSGDNILGFFNDEKYSKEAFKQIASQIPVGTTLDNKKVKQLGFGIKVSGGIIATSNEATTIGDLAIDKKSTGDQYVIYDQGTKTEGTFTSEPQLITLSIDPSEHKLPEYTKMFGRYVLATKDSSGNWKHIPIYPTKLKNLTSKLQDKYFNDLKAELDRLKGVKEIDTDALYEFNAEVNKDVFISLSKEEVKKSGVDGIEVTLDINSKGNLRVNIVYITRTGGETKTTRKKLVIKDNAIGNNLDTLIEAINSQNPGFVLTKDSFKKSIPTGTMYQVKGDEFEAYIEPQVFKGQKVTMTVDNTAMALNTIEETKVDNLSLFNVDPKADIEKRRQEDLKQSSIIPITNYLYGNSPKEALVNFREYFKKVLAWEHFIVGYNKPSINLDFGKGDVLVTASVQQLAGGSSFINVEVNDVINAKYDAELEALEGTKSKPKSIIQQAKENAKKDPKGPELDNTLFKTGAEVVDNLITNKEIDDLKNIIPQGIEVQTKKDLTTFFDNILKDKIVWGYFKDKVIYLSTGAGLGTGYHEAFHAIFRYGMTNDEVKRYLALAAKDLNSKYTKSQIESKLADLRVIYGDVSNINKLLLEEHLADEFMKYKNNKLVQVGLKSLFRRFVNMLKALVGISSQLDSLFGQIERGDFAARVATKNDISSDLVFKNVPSGETSFLTQSKSKKLINTYATRVAKISKSWDGKSKKLSNEQILDSLLSERKDVLETLAVDYIENVTDNIKKERLKKSLKDEYYSLQNPIGNQILKNEVLKKLDLFNITEEENEQDGSDNTTERFGNKDAWMLSMEETLPKQIRQYIAFATYKTIDELTGEEVDMSVDAETIYNGLSHVLANTAEDDILNKWIAYAKDNDQAKAVLDMVMSDTGMSYDDNGSITDPTKNFNDLRKIITAFKRVKVQFQHTEFNPIYDFTSKSLTSNKVDTYNANRNTPEKIQMNNWANNLQNISSKERPSKEEWNTRAKEAVASLTKNINNEITNDIIKDIKTKVSKLGINLSNGFIRYSLIALKEKVGNASAEELEYNSNFDVEPLDIDIFTSTEYGLSKLLSEGKDVFGKVEGIRGRLETIAKANSMFDESIATSNFKGADGNTRYDIILPSYALDEALRLKSKSYREYLIQKYPVLTNNIFINNDKIMNDFKIGIVAGLRDHTKTDNEGKVFGDYSEREYLSQYLGYWFGQKNKKAQFLFRQNEASNTAYTAELPIVEYFTDKISDKAIDTVFEFFKGEYNRIGIETAKGLGNIKGYNDTDKGRAFRFTEFSNLLYSMTPTEYNQLTADAKNGNELTDDQIGRIKYILKTNLAKGMSDFKNLLEENKFGKFKGGILSSNFLIPTNFGSDNSEITHQLNNLYLNDYINSFGVNQLLDGDYALSRDDKGGVEVEIDGVKVIVPKQPIQIDITKRNKGAMGSGPDMGKGTHRVAYTKDINAYVEDEPVNGNLVRVPDDSKIYKDSDGSSYILKGDVKVKVSKVNSSDAQSYNTINHVIFMAERLGRLDETVKTILRKVRRGIPINGGEQKTLQNAQVSLNPWKTVTFGREFYIKTSEALLDRHEVSIVTNQDRFNELMDELESLEDSNTLDIDKLITINKQLVELYEAIPGKEYYHKILNQMDIHGIDQVVAESASKGATLSPVDTMLDEFDLSVSMQDIPNGYKRLQVETPTGKTEITSGTQLMQLIDSEQNDEIKIGKTSVGELRKKYRELMASSRSNSFRLAEQLIREKDGNIDITRLSDKFLKSLEASGADDQLLEIFSKNWNLLPAIDKAEQLFLAHFGNGVLSQKVPGTKVALMSDAHFRLVVDENDKPVLNKTVKSNPSKYKQSKTRKLLHNVKDPVTGEIYSECVLSERVFSKFGLKIGDAIPTELATMLGYRIPTQDKHSMISLRVVDVLPIHLEGTGIFPQEIVYLSGADFDIDSLFIQQPSFWMNDGVPTKYGTEKTIEDKWTAYLNYILANKDIQLSVSKKRQFGPDLTKEEFDELTPEAKEFLYDTYNRQTLKEFGLPSTMKEYEKYLKSGKKIINNEINNDILDIELKLLTNSHMLEKIAYTPVSSDPLVKVAKKIMELKGLSDSDKNSVHDILGKFKAFSQNSAGKSGIGIVANALQAFTFLARNKTKRDGTLIKINGKEFNSFEYINSIGNRAADLLSTILSVMTDNAKDPIAGKMGLSLELLPTYTYLVSLGVSEESAALLINIPIIQKYSNLKKENKFGIKSSYEKGMTNDGKIIKLLVDELGIEKTKADTYSIFKLKDASSNIEFDDLTNEGLIKDGITKDNTEVQLQLLGKFLKIEEEAESFRDLNNVIKLTKGLATNFNDLDKNLVESLYRLGIDGLFKTPYKEIDKTTPFNITNAVKEDSLLFSNIVMALNSIKKADGIFITESPLFKVQFEKLLNNLKDKLSKDTLADAKRSFLGFLTTKAYVKLLTDNRTAAGMKNAKVTMNDELLFPELGGKTLAAELIELKNSKNENISENTFIKWLAPSLKSNNPKQVIDLVSGKSFIKLSKDTINDILDGYKELFNNAETNEFAIKAFNYLLVKDNLEYKNDSFVKYIAPYMFNTVSDSLNLAVSQLAKKEDIEKVFGADMISLGDEFREIYSAYKPNQYKSVVVKKGDKMGMKTFADSNNKAMLVSDNGSTITFNTEADATADPDRKSENMSYLTGIFDSKKDKDSKQVTFKFPEFMVIKVGKEERLYKTDVSGMVKWDTYAEYKQVEQFGYPNVSPYPKSLKDSRATQAKLGSLIRTNEEEEYSEDGELTNPMDVFSTSTKDKVVSVEEVFGNILSSSDSDAFDNGPDNFDLVFGEINTGNKLQESEKNSILGKDFNSTKADVNSRIMGLKNVSEDTLKELLSELNTAKTKEDLGKLIDKICNF